MARHTKLTSTPKNDGRAIVETEGFQHEPDPDMEFEEALRGVPAEQARKRRKQRALAEAPELPEGCSWYELTGTGVSKNGAHHGLGEVIAMTDFEVEQMRHLVTPVEWDDELGQFVRLIRGYSRQPRAMSRVAGK